MNVFSKICLGGFVASIFLFGSYFGLAFGYTGCLSFFSGGVFWEPFSGVFIFMVLFVSFFVYNYSVLYLKFYEMNKFFILLNFFVASMVLLSVSSSPLALSVGWDLLGISSILLIMFYPNKVTTSNSFLTFFYNRLSDVLLVFSLFIFSSVYCQFYFLVDNLGLVILLLGCSFLKSAQYPFSSWLPAAMSAPTPISSLVHSSTLVTAGILVCLKMVGVTERLGAQYLVSSLFLLGVIMGGLLANWESDAKKIVAFSTMSQISLILFMGVSGMVSVSLLHMIFHAFFKSFLFVFCGFIFLTIFSSQSFFFLPSSSGSWFIFSSLVLSVYLMTGLPFSSSFYTKDHYLEMLSAGDSFWSTFFFLMGAFLTLFYCKKIFSICQSGFNLNSAQSYQSCGLIFVGFFLLVRFGFTGVSGFPWGASPLVSMGEVNLLSFLLIFSFLFSKGLWKKGRSAVTDVFFTKSMTTIYVSKLMMDLSHSSSLSDSFWKKSSSIPFFEGKLPKFNLKSENYILLPMLFYLLF